MAEALDAIRFVHFAAAMAAFGIGAFRIYALAGDSAAARLPAWISFDGVLVRATTAGAWLALVSAMAIIPLVAAEMAASAAAAVDPETVDTVLFRTQFGQAWCWHVGFAVALLATSTIRPRRSQVIAATTTALLLLVSLGWVGHAAEDEGAVRAMREVNQMVHLIAGGIWLGGLVPLGFLLRRAIRPDGGAYIPLARTALPHFSQMGYAAVALIALTGMVNGILLVGSFDALTMTPYGRLLILKIALFAAMTGLALVNRLRLMPRLGASAAAAVPLRALFRSVIVEQALGAAILAVVAVLGTWPPAIMAAMR
jgi:putative copper resistance protein D